MLRKLEIVLTIIALGMTSIQTHAFARGGDGGSGGHIGGGQSGAPGYGMDRGAFDSRASGLHDRGRSGFGNDSGLSNSCWSRPYSYRYPHCYDGYFF